MTLMELICLSLFCFISIIFISILLYKNFFYFKLNFNVIFSFLFLLTFYFGFPLTCILTFKFSESIIKSEYLFYTQLSSISFYIVYYIVYNTNFSVLKSTKRRMIFNINKIEINLFCILLMLISIITIFIFFLKNGFLLFKLKSYDQIFSNQVFLVGLKRFFYFFIPAMLIIYFLKPTKKRWFFFLFSTIIFGFFTYFVVGGTRANIIIPFSLFLFIGINRKWIKLWMLIVFFILSIVIMFFLALNRYGINVSWNKLFYIMLYFTRDTFSPWENLALILSYYEKLDFQNLSPIIRDFYVFIPSWVWPERPNVILNSANYFTWKILNNYSGLSISPTLIGSFIIMGGVFFIPLGGIVVGLFIKWFDWIYNLSLRESNRYKASVLKSFCFSLIFNIIVLVREGIDSFVSRFFFFCIIFGFCLIFAKILYCLFENAGVVYVKKNNLKIIIMK
ncbi:ECA oligosaccharide polymerase [Candidatus Providencia siddallii]|uniref:ECA polymerase n=1 Tax=Candidatus Providencia siddallii TaxID=1715285 RepID=A0ABP1CE83_9GAMM